MDLAQLFNYYGSDKDRNGYSQIYHTLFDSLKDKPLNVLEIGIGTLIPEVNSSMLGFGLEHYKPGGSLRAWRDYFKNSQIYGFDIQSDTQFNDEERINTYLCNSTDRINVINTIETISDEDEGAEFKFDIIIDDGSHHDEHQLLTLKYLYSYLKDGGLYIIEDIYPGSRITTQPHLLTTLCKGDPYFFVGLGNNICVIYKKKLFSNRVAF